LPDFESAGPRRLTVVWIALLPWVGVVPFCHVLSLPPSLPRSRSRSRSPSELVSVVLMLCRPTKAVDNRFVRLDVPPLCDCFRSPTREADGTSDGSRGNLSPPSVLLSPSPSSSWFAGPVCPRSCLAELCLLFFTPFSLFPLFPLFQTEPQLLHPALAYSRIRPRHSHHHQAKTTYPQARRAKTPRLGFFCHFRTIQMYAVGRPPADAPLLLLPPV
jgi:hypothetical protein